MAEKASKGRCAIAPERLAEIREAVEALPAHVAAGRIRPATGSDWSDYATDLLTAYDALTPAPTAPLAAAEAAGDWFPPTVFSSAAEYDESVKSAAARIASGEIQPREPDEDDSQLNEPAV